DLSASKGGICISVTAIGEAANEHIKYRSGARPGDLIFTTGPIGDSRAGLEALLEGGLLSGETGQLVNQHLRPKLYLKEAEFLGQQPAVTAMMDLSDGLFQDLAKLVEASKCGAEVWVEKVGLSDPLRQFCVERGYNT